MVMTVFFNELWSNDGDEVLPNILRGKLFDLREEQFLGWLHDLHKKGQTGSKIIRRPISGREVVTRWLWT